MSAPRNIKNEIIELRKKGKTYNEIVKALNCGKSTVQYHCKQNGLTDIGFKLEKVSEEQALEIYNFCKDNTINQAVSAFNLSRSTIKKYKKRADNH